MTGPNDRILPPGGLGPKQQPIYIGVDLSSQPDQTAAQIVLTREALAALPEVQAIVREAVEAEREACAAEGDRISDKYWRPMVVTRTEEEAAVDDGKMDAAFEVAAAIRKRGEG